MKAIWLFYLQYIQSKNVKNFLSGSKDREKHIV